MRKRKKAKTMATRFRGDLMKDDWSDESKAWLEDQLQIAIVQQLRRMRKEYDFDFAASLEGVRMSKSQAGKAKLMGMESGEPDIRIYFNGGDCLLIELKADKGVVSKNQKDRHHVLGKLGFEVMVLKFKTPQEAKECIEQIIIDRC